MSDDPLRRGKFSNCVVCKMAIPHGKELCGECMPDHGLNCGCFRKNERLCHDCQTYICSHTGGSWTIERNTWLCTKCSHEREGNAREGK